MKNKINLYLKTEDYLILSVFSVIEIVMSLLTFVPILSVAIQLFIFFGTIILFKNRPIFFLIVTQFFLINLQNILSTKTDREFINVSSEGYYLNYNIVLLLFGVYLIFDFLKKKTRTKVNRPILFLCFLAFLSLIWAQTDLYYNNEFVLLLLLYLGGHIFIISDYDIRLLLFSTLINGVIFTIISIPYLLKFSQDVIYNMVLDTNYGSLYCMVIVASGYICLIVYNELLNYVLRVFIFLVIFLSGIFIILTMSRTGLIVYLVAFIYYLYKTSSVNIKNIFFYVFLICLLSFFSFKSTKYFFYLDNAIERFNSDDVKTMNNRTDIADSYLNQFSQSDFFTQIFGNGYYSTFVPHIAPHNSFIAILSFFGFLGSILFIWYFVDLFKRILNTKYRPFELFLLVFIIFGITLETFKFQMLVLMLSILFAVRKLKPYSQIS